MLIKKKKLFNVIPQNNNERARPRFPIIVSIHKKVEVITFSKNDIFEVLLSER